MSTQHTPGPWFTRHEGFSTVYIEARLRAGVLQEVAACGPTEAGSEQQEANARLIAAAPDLLLALQSLYDLVAEEVADGEYIEQAIKARAAIAKATGAAS